MTCLHDYALPVHKSIQQPDLLFGLPKTVFMVIVVVAIIAVYLFGLWAGLIAVVLYIPARIISKDDPLMLTIAFESLMEPDFLEA